jgi:ribosome-associated protein
LDLYAKPPKPRKATKPTYGSVKRRLEGKSMQSRLKASRRNDTGD